MRLLIVDDNRQQAEIAAELLREVDRGAKHIEAIRIASDLESAVPLLPRHDVVLCDGQFPVSPNFGYRNDQWLAVYQEAVHHGIVFILHSADRDAVYQAQRRRLPVIIKPTRIEQLYAALIHYFRGLGETAVVGVANDQGMES